MLCSMVLAVPPLWQWKITEGLWRTYFFSLEQNIRFIIWKPSSHCFLKRRFFLYKRKQGFSMRPVHKIHATQYEYVEALYTSHKINMLHSLSHPGDLLKSVRGQIFHFVLVTFPWISECIVHCNHKQKILQQILFYYNRHQSFLSITVNMIVR